ncbi:MAG TPA: multicopper oxidase domain-containing protein [Acidobacteriaceae bacterium]|nr:multicopper oxidase domain-containing protein [Acidobacteriaceae bacterium]
MQAMELVRATPPGAACDPAAEVSYNGNIVTVSIGVEEHQNTIYNPGNPATNYKDTVSLRSYGGCLTGPQIEAKPGTTLRVNLTNNLAKDDPSCPHGMDPVGQPGCFNTINMHFHGLHVSPSGNSDNVLLNIAPSTRFDYEVNIPEDHPAGTFWYHAHRHGSTAMQVASGASGVLIIRGNRPYVPATATTPAIPGDIDTILRDANGAYKEKVFLFQQIPYACFDSQGNIIGSGASETGAWECPAGKIGVVENFNAQLSSPTAWDFSGRYTSINGVVQPEIRDIKAGEIQRWRFIHGGIHDTVNIQIVPMVNVGPDAAKALQGIIPGTPAAQAKILAEVCPNRPADEKDKTLNLVPQLEIAADGLTRTQMLSLGIKDGKPEKATSGGVGTNFLQPGYRSDVLVTFPHKGRYCVLNQAATPDERASAKNNNGPGGQGPNRLELLATVVVEDGKEPTVDPETYVKHALYDANPQLPAAARDGLLKGNLEPWRGMPDLTREMVTSDLQKVDFFIGTPPSPPTPPATPPTPPSTTWTGAFGFFVNYKEYDPDRIDFTRQVNTVDNWQLTSQGEPHIFHIHVNPFEVMDVIGPDHKSIFDHSGVCLVPADSVGLQNQYCGMWHQFKDTVFVQNGYTVLTRTKYDRYIGEFVIHCHILDHEDGGMMTNIQIVPDLGAPGNGIGMAGMRHHPPTK